ncbi:uncharacterized protein ATNIH1004_007642 [Aspergillus tanneri]|uniref:Uncharacterized protein n=1 Tax=Aspergillus tanneri TaxID=1220188 RepID=A0A5M9MGV4_9EURO|nr:uncharacterized protein ATNIH1004_007642 [Aspergillus tanneri]KAA8646215.1 hypothetical protein ATNIH1004_007642 [Aspergillus tanneri]
MLGQALNGQATLEAGADAEAEAQDEDLSPFLYGSSVIDPRDSQAVISIAALKGDVTIVRLLLEFVVDPDASTGKLKSAVMYLGCRVMDMNTCQEVKTDHKDNNVPISLAAFSQHPAIVQLLLEQGVSIDTEPPLNGNYNTLLQQAARTDRTAISEVLWNRIDVDSKITAKDPEVQLLLTITAPLGMEDRFASADAPDPDIINIKHDYGQHGLPPDRQVGGDMVISPSSRDQKVLESGYRRV